MGMESGLHFSGLSGTIVHTGEVHASPPDVDWFGLAMDTFRDANVRQQPTHKWRVQVAECRRIYRLVGLTGPV